MSMLEAMTTAFDEAERNGGLVPLCDRCDLRYGNAPCTCPQRSCSDCTAYLPERKMFEMSDGRKCCRNCADAARRRAEDARQMNMFVEQERLFG